ncbi:hypothetical protein TpMuguga_03g00188 [Theileria parva strain Muguga]|uniref:Uncharacterized protein n=1 Tax=Theileria parva TaxID=5875 RepID=Q4N0F6_THEPA|nr:uncharacterized protein TpMuguga_03g00188 [Theileria parva strain Muguga]EAN30923.1 hypothetical protein TpMuguga_03g00188 [Theileria parva strain Muguga]|eukprot:XP_763206.1 hypothetical protein [Theileria parva strain Muguga]
MVKRFITRITRFFSALYHWFKNLFDRKSDSDNLNVKLTNFKDIELGKQDSISTDCSISNKNHMENYMTMEYEFEETYDSEFPKLPKNSQDNFENSESNSDIVDVAEQIHEMEELMSEDTGSTPASEAPEASEASEESEGSSERGVEESSERGVEESLDVHETPEDDVEESKPEADESSEDDEEYGVDMRSVEEAMKSMEVQELQLPKGSVGAPTEKPVRKLKTEKLNWEPKASVPKYSMTLNSKLLKEDGVKTSVTTRGKGLAMVQKITEINQTKVKSAKEQFKKELEEKRAAEFEARAKIVEAERKRVAEAKKKLEMKALKTKQEALERYKREKEEKVKIRSENEAVKEKILKAKVDAIISSKK